MVSEDDSHSLMLLKDEYEYALVVIENISREVGKLIDRCKEQKRNHRYLIKKRRISRRRYLS